MTCPTCTHGPTPCNHPLVAPFEGEPPSEQGAAVVAWCADNVRAHPKTNRVQIRSGRQCPGFGAKTETT